VRVKKEFVHCEKRYEKRSVSQRRKKKPVAKNEKFVAK